MPLSPKIPTRIYATSLVQGLKARAQALNDLQHRVTKGQLRELLLDELLSHYLSSQFGTGSGVVINAEGTQSRQTDIIVWDRQVITPLVRLGNVGVYPWESVIATIEVKSSLTKAEILKSEKNAEFLMTKVYPPEFRFAFPALFGFYGNGSQELQDEEAGLAFLQKNVRHLRAICLLGQFSWIVVQGKWARRRGDQITCEETKRFIAVLLDNVRTLAQMRWRGDGVHHRDWIGSYIRDQV